MVVRIALGAVSKKNVYYKDLSAPVLDLLWSAFEEALKPLRETGKWGVVHFQFAPWLVYSPQSKAHLDDVRARLPDYMLSVELRHHGWFKDVHAGETLEFEKEQALVNVVLDEPQGFANSVAAHWEVTNPSLAVVRLHGRNAETWNIKGAMAASERFTTTTRTRSFRGSLSRSSCCRNGWHSRMSCSTTTSRTRVSATR